MKQVYSIRLEESEVQRIKAIAIEGNVSQWIRLLIKKELERMNFEKLEKDRGAVEFKGKKYWLTQQAYTDNSGTDGDVVYRSHAIDKNNNKYLVTWETTEDYDKACELYGLTECKEKDYEYSEEELERIKTLENEVCVDYTDETQACDWDNPVSVDEI